jgi:hypothetical protein
MGDKKAPTRPTTRAGAVGLASAPKWASLLPPSSLLYPNRKVPLLSKPSCRASEMSDGMPVVNLLAVLNGQWWRALCSKPQATWLQRFRNVSNPAPSTWKTRKFYNTPSNPFSEHSKTLIPPSPPLESHHTQIPQEALQTQQCRTVCHARQRPSSHCRALHSGILL